MATPASETGPMGDDHHNQEQQGQITFRFCSECLNMLYPKEDEEARELQFTCRTCQYTEKAKSYCVFRHITNNAADKEAGITGDVASDPTVGASDPNCLPVICIVCGTAIVCSQCSLPSPHLGAVPINEELQDLGLLGLQLAFNNIDHSELESTASSSDGYGSPHDFMTGCDDPFAEYDEEPESAETSAVPSPTDESPSYWKAALTAYRNKP